MSEDLKSVIEAAWEARDTVTTSTTGQVRDAVHETIEQLDAGSLRVAQDLDRAWEVLGEAVQTVMRAHGIPDAYDRLKSFTRGRPIDKHAMREFIAASDLPPAEKERLLCLEPKDYVGLAPVLARRGRGS